MRERDGAGVLERGARHAEQVRLGLHAAELRRLDADAAAGIVWIAVAFSGTLALGRTFERERYGDTLRALLP